VNPPFTGTNGRPGDWSYSVEAIDDMFGSQSWMTPSFAVANIGPGSSSNSTSIAGGNGGNVDDDSNGNENVTPVLVEVVGGHTPITNPAHAGNSLGPNLNLDAVGAHAHPTITSGVNGNNSNNNETLNLDAVGTHAHPTGTSGVHGTISNSNKTVTLEVIASPTLAMGHSHTGVSGMPYRNRNECESSLSTAPAAFVPQYFLEMNGNIAANHSSLLSKKHAQVETDDHKAKSDSGSEVIADGNANSELGSGEITDDDAKSDLGLDDNAVPSDMCLPLYHVVQSMELLCNGTFKKAYQDAFPDTIPRFCACLKNNIACGKAIHERDGGGYCCKNALDPKHPCLHAYCLHVVSHLLEAANANVCHVHIIVLEMKTTLTSHETNILPYCFIVWLFIVSILLPTLIFSLIT
jgi:hypothetical protein